MLLLVRYGRVLGVMVAHVAFRTPSLVSVLLVQLFLSSRIDLRSSDFHSNCFDLLRSSHRPSSFLTASVDIELS